MQITNVRADQVEFGMNIRVGKEFYIHAGNAYAESDMMIVNFFLTGIHDGLLGKIIVPKDFLFEVEVK